MVLFQRTIQRWYILHKNEFWQNYNSWIEWIYFSVCFLTWLAQKCVLYFICITFQCKMTKIGRFYRINWISKLKGSFKLIQSISQTMLLWLFYCSLKLVIRLFVWICYRKAKGRNWYVSKDYKTMIHFTYKRVLTKLKLLNWLNLVFQFVSCLN